VALPVALRRWSRRRGRERRAAMSTMVRDGITLAYEEREAPGQVNGMIEGFLRHHV